MLNTSYIPVQQRKNSSKSISQRTLQEAGILLVATVWIRAEVFIRANSLRISPIPNLFSTVILLFLTTFLLIVTYYFTKICWGRPLLSGSPDFR